MTPMIPVEDHEARPDINELPLSHPAFDKLFDARLVRRRERLETDPPADDQSETVAAE
jgi:hypothetical protein